MGVQHMARGIGKALASAIKEPAQGGSHRQGRHIFRNLHRRHIFSLLTFTPCIGISRLAEGCGVSHRTAEWHAGELVDSGYIIMYASGRKKLFYPQGLITGEMTGLFEALNHPRTGLAFRTVLVTPGITQAGLAAAAGQSRRAVAGSVDRLANAGLVSRMAEGPNIRYYPTALLPESGQAFYGRSRDFSDFILRKLEAEGGKPPEVVKRGVDTLVVELGYASERFTLELGINPYMTCTVC